jgi:zinc transporter ZupT
MSPGRSENPPAPCPLRSGRLISFARVDAFSYLSVLISIVIGLAITQILQGYRTLLISRRRVRFFGPTLAWGGLLLLIAVQSWWAMFGMRQHARWTFVEFAILLLQTILLYLLAALVIPDVGCEQDVDLKDH